MTFWLKKRLVLWFGSALALFVVGVRVTAQPHFGGKPVDTPPATMGESARLFGRLLQVLGEQEDREGWDSNGPFPPESYLEIRLISRHDRQQLGLHAIDILLAELAKYQTPVYESGEPHQENGKTVIDITPKAASVSSAPVVLVKEEGGYRVDLLATYAKRLKLGPGVLETDIYNKTDIALDGLPGRDEPLMRRDICQSQMKEIDLGLALYVQDYDEVMPPAKQWQEGLEPYVRNDEIFTCPSLSKSQKYGYALNSKVSAKSLVEFSTPAKTIFIYETTLLKRNAYGVGDNLAFRHENGANYAFANGSVKWFANTQIPSFKLKP